MRFFAGSFAIVLCSFSQILLAANSYVITGTVPVDGGRIYSVHGTDSTTPLFDFFGPLTLQQPRVWEHANGKVYALFVTREKGIQYRGPLERGVIETQYPVTSFVPLNDSVLAYDLKTGTAESLSLPDYPSTEKITLKLPDAVFLSPSARVVKSMAHQRFFSPFGSRTDVTFFLTNKGLVRHNVRTGTKAPEQSTVFLPLFDKLHFLKDGKTLDLTQGFQMIAKHQKNGTSTLWILAKGREMGKDASTFLLQIDSTDSMISISAVHALETKNAILYAAMPHELVLRLGGRLATIPKQIPLNPDPILEISRVQFARDSLTYSGMILEELYPSIEMQTWNTKVLAHSFSFVYAPILVSFTAGCAFEIQKQKVGPAPAHVLSPEGL